MRRKLLSVAVVVLLCVATFCPTEHVLACGPFFPSVIFTSTEFPGVPLRRFVAGELGILQPTFSERYLVVAYRYLNGDPLRAPEQAAVLTLARNENTNDEGVAGYLPASKKWLKERERVPGITPIKEIDTDRAMKFYDSYSNCLDPAFETAIATLKKRVEQFGIESAPVREWLNGQDAVFANCGGGPKQKTLSIPPPVDQSLPPIIRDDRKYQTAAAHFYAGEFDEAGTLFREISSDSQSPWRTFASLLVARCLIRKATINGGQEGFAEKILSEAEAVLEKIIADPTLEEVHQGAERLQGFVQLRLNPLARRKLLAGRLAKADDQHFLQDLIDYRSVTKGGDDFSGINAVMSSQLNLAHGAMDPLSDWMKTFQASDPQARAHAVEQWRQTGSLAWLVAALTYCKSSDTHVAELIAAGRKVGVNSPGYLTVTFHRLRLEAASGRRDLAREEIDALRGNKNLRWSRSDENLFLALRMSLAKNLEEWLKYSIRSEAAYLPDGEGYEPAQPLLDDAEVRKQGKENAGPYFDSDSAWTFTLGLPTALLVQAVESDWLPSSLRRQVAETAWVRSVEIGDDASAIRLAPIVGKLEPKLSPEMNEFVAAADADSRRYSATLTILRMPGLRPYVGVGISRVEQIQTTDNYRNNWWCGLGTSNGKGYFEAWSELYSPMNSPEHPQVFDQFYTGGHVTYPAFLSAQERAIAAKEWSKLVGEETGTQRLAKEALAWAKAHPDDERAPEGLHLAVHALRYGCEVKGNSRISKEAFDLLHRRYPKSDWTKKTPYWF